MKEASPGSELGGASCRMGCARPSPHASLENPKAEFQPEREIQRVRMDRAWHSAEGRHEGAAACTAAIRLTRDLAIGSIDL